MNLNGAVMSPAVSRGIPCSPELGGASPGESAGRLVSRSEARSGGNGDKAQSGFSERLRELAKTGGAEIPGDGAAAVAERSESLKEEAAVAGTKVAESEKPEPEEIEGIAGVPEMPETSQLPTGYESRESAMAMFPELYELLAEYSKLDKSEVFRALQGLESAQGALQDIREFAELIARVKAAIGEQDAQGSELRLESGATQSLASAVIGSEGAAESDGNHGAEVKTKSMQSKNAVESGPRETEAGEINANDSQSTKGGLAQLSPLHDLAAGNPGGAGIAQVAGNAKPEGAAEQSQVHYEPGALLKKPDFSRKTRNAAVSENGKSGERGAFSQIVSADRGGKSNPEPKKAEIPLNADGAKSLQKAVLPPLRNADKSAVAAGSAGSAGSVFEFPEALSPAELRQLRANLEFVRQYVESGADKSANKPEQVYRAESPQLHRVAKDAPQFGEEGKSEPKPEQVSNLQAGQSGRAEVAGEGKSVHQPVAAQISAAITERIDQIAQITSKAEGLAESHSAAGESGESRQLSEFKVTLKPEHLGKVTVRLTVETADGVTKIAVTIVTENDTARDLLAARAQSVKVMVEMSGVTVERYEVETAKQTAVHAAEQAQYNESGERDGDNGGSGGREESGKSGESGESGDNDGEEVTAFSELVQLIQSMRGGV